MSADIDLATLSKTQGIKIIGATPNDNAGFSVSGAGDINNDGIDDILIGAFDASPFNRINAGESYIIFGNKNKFDEINLRTLSSPQGFKIEGGYPANVIGFSVKRAGDVNDDSIDDIIIGAPNASPFSRRGAGESYVIYGSNNIFNNIDLSIFDLSQGFKIEGAYSDGFSGFSVSGAGDVNGDGIDDIIIGTSIYPHRAPTVSESYVIYGSKNGFENIDLLMLNITQGFKIAGAALLRELSSVNEIGDINNDGLDDVIIGAPHASPLNRTQAGESYVIYGSKNGFENIDLLMLNITQGFRIMGAYSNDTSGNSVSKAGDFNGDGIDDIIIGAPNAGLLNREDAGISYIIYGKNNTNFNNIDLRILNNTEGIKIYGASAGSHSGLVSWLGDVNSDGLDDIIIGAPYASPLNRTQAGESYVIYGSKNGFEDIDLLMLNITQGFRIMGAYSNELSGFSISGAGDVNGDGANDIIIGAPPTLTKELGVSYVIYGSPIFPPPISSPWWEPYVEIGVPIVGGLCLIGIGAFSWYKYNHCNGCERGDSPEQTALVNQVSHDSGPWYT